MGGRVSKIGLGVVHLGLPDPERRRDASADAGPAAGTSRLTFRLRVDPGGPMAPMVNAMMKPMMLPAAEGLANQILATLEERHGLK